LVGWGLLRYREKLGCATVAYRETFSLLGCKGIKRKNGITVYAATIRKRFTQQVQALSQDESGSGGLNSNKFLLPVEKNE